MGAAEFLTMLNELESLSAGYFSAGYYRHGLRIGGMGIRSGKKYTTGEPAVANSFGLRQNQSNHRI